jgi:predicted DNA-binding protein (UPF0251 family)
LPQRRGPRPGHPELFTPADRKAEQRKEWEADRLLSQAGYRNKDSGIYSESDIMRREARELQLVNEHPERCIEFHDPTEIDDTTATIGELIDAANLTPQQLQAARLAAGIITPPNTLPGARLTQAQIAEYMGIKRTAVNRLLKRAKVRMYEAIPIVEAKLPADWVVRLFWEEVRYKTTLVYYKRVTRFKLKSPKLIKKNDDEV